MPSICPRNASCSASAASRRNSENFRLDEPALTTRMEPLFIGQFLHRCAVWSPSACGTGKCLRQDRLRFLLDALQVVAAAKTFGIQLVDLLRARRARGEPALRGDNLQSADGRAVAGRTGEHGLDRVAGQVSRCQWPAAKAFAARPSAPPWRVHRCARTPARRVRG